MDYYNAEHVFCKYVHRDKFTKKWGQKFITNFTIWKKYFQNYHVLAELMLKRGKISQKNFETYFWLELSISLYDIFEPKIQAQISHYNVS